LSGSFFFNNKEKKQETMSASRKSTGKTDRVKSAATNPQVPKSAGGARKLSVVESRRSSIESDTSYATSRSANSAVKPLPKLFGPILPLRRCSAGSNLQTHPCFQSSLFNDQERAAGSFKEWRERMIEKRLINPNESAKAEARKDYQLKQVLWTESVSS